MPDSSQPFSPPVPFDISDASWRALGEWIGQTADPPEAFRRLERLSEAHGSIVERRRIFHEALSDPLWGRRLALALGNSPFLANILQKWPEFLQQWFIDERFPDAETLKTELTNAVLAVDSRKEAEQILREWKNRIFLRIGLWDLNQEWGLFRVTGALSALADAAIEAAYRWLDRDLSGRLGAPLTHGEDQPPRPARFVVLAMGKLGARELNFSSDVDLIYLYDGDQGGTDSASPTSLKGYFIRLGRELIRMLSTPTADGMVFRIDLRLRPEGESGDLALSARSAEIYYESWGQTWERAALIKARPCAGDLALGEAFLENMRPFVFRRYLDFEALESIREMKHKIDRKVRQAADYRHNLKLGYGGIREIEFFVQTQQLIRGGQEPRLRSRQTVRTLETLQELGFLAAETVDHLRRAYILLRTVEHRLQIEREGQVHSLPTDPEAFAQVGRRMGIADPARLTVDLDEAREGVHSAYKGLFLDSERIRRETTDPRVAAITACDASSEVSLNALGQAGFSDPAKARELLVLLQKGPPGPPASEATLRWYERLAPGLITELLTAPDQEMALANVQTFLVWVGRRANYLALMVEHPGVVHLLVRLFGSSPFLSRVLNHHPELMDNLISRDFLESFPSRDQLARTLREQLARAEDEEVWIQTLNDFKNAALLRIGLRDLSGLADIPEVMAELSAVAETVLGQVVIEARNTLEERYGAPGFLGDDGDQVNAQFAVIALGKLGGREINYASDLDLIFVHDSAGQEQWTDGERAIDNGEFFTKLGQRIISRLTNLTRSGRLYELDMRLRPSGNSGPLVTSFDSFRNYHHNEAWTWEHQALTRARVVSGDRELGQRLSREIREILCLPRDPEEVRREISEMRRRIDGEKAPPEGVIDIKLSAGGVVDIEFLVQYFILSRARSAPRLIQRNTLAALFALKNEGLLSAEVVETLAESYQFLRLVENRLRLLHDRSENRVERDPVVLERLRRLCGMAAEASIAEALEERLEAVVFVYNQHLSR